MADGMGVNTRSLRRFAEDLRWVYEDLATGVPAIVNDGAETIAQTMRDKATGYPVPSSEGNVGRQAVADSIHVRSRSGNTAVIRAGGDNIPLAGLWELGNKGSDPNAGEFTHPVFGRGEETQRKWMYLRMAIREREPSFIAVAIERILRFFLRHDLPTTGI